MCGLNGFDCPVKLTYKDFIDKFWLGKNDEMMPGFFRGKENSDMSNRFALRVKKWSLNEQINPQKNLSINFGRERMMK